MSANAMNKPSATNWARVDALDDGTIDTSDVPPLSESFFSRAKLRVPRSYVAVTLSVDSEVVGWFKAQGETWEQRMNAALRLYVEAHEAAKRPPESAA
jgi:uncharacterized protein (DUF4415 family)